MWLVNGVIKNKRRLLLVALPVLLATAVAGEIAEALATPEENPATWYQLDVIIFKPEVQNLNEENWREVEAAYPHDVIAITQGQDVRPFRLSQLEQMRAEAAEAEQAERLEINFPDTSLLESLTSPDDNSSSNDDEGAGNSLYDEPYDEPPEPAILDLDELLAAAAAQSFSSIAFEPRLAKSSLAGIARSLHRSSHFEVLSHQSWVQPVTEQATSIMIQAGQRFDDEYEVEGTLTFNRGRYIHLRAQLWYTLYEQQFRSNNPYRTLFESEPDNTTPAENNDPVEKELVEVEKRRGLYAPLHTYQMTQARRLQTGKVHYLDHPLFGVIVRVTKYE